MNLIEHIEKRLFSKVSLNENANREPERKLRKMMRSVVDTNNGLKFGSLTNVRPSPDLDGYLEFAVKITMNAGALRNAIQDLKARGFDITKKEWDPKQSRLSALFLQRSTGEVEATEDEKKHRKPHQLDYDMKLANEATAPLRKEFKKIAPSTLFNPIEFIGSTKGFVYIVYEGFVEAKDLNVDIGVAPPPTPPTPGGRGRKGGKKKQKPGVSENSVPTVLEILQAMGLEKAEELSGEAAMQFEANMQEEGFAGGIIQQVTDATVTDYVMNTYDHLIYKVITSTSQSIDSPSVWRSQIQPSLSDGYRYAGPNRRVPGRILNKNKENIYIAVYAEVFQDFSSKRGKPLPRGSVRFHFLIYSAAPAGASKK